MTHKKSLVVTSTEALKFKNEALIKLKEPGWVTDNILGPNPPKVVTLLEWSWALVTAYPQTANKHLRDTFVVGGWGYYGGFARMVKENFVQAVIKASYLNILAVGDFKPDEVKTLLAMASNDIPLVLSEENSAIFSLRREMTK